MDKPRLWVVAGCNGAGKSSFSKAILGGKTIPFDYDTWFLFHFKSLHPSEIQDRMAHNLAFEELERQIAKAIEGRSDFCYETNFNSTPLHWPETFRSNGYQIHLIYFVLDSIEQAKERVKIRVENGGHFVPDNEIRKRYFEGFENLNRHFRYFDSIDLFDCSHFKEEPKFCFSLNKGKPELVEFFPEFLKPLIPAIANGIESN